MPAKAKTKKVKVEKVSTIQEVRADINPQLAKTYNPDKFTWEHPWVVEPKFDGLRCIVIAEFRGTQGDRYITPYSRNGKPLWNMGRIIDEVETNSPKMSEFVLDGEVYTKDWNLSMSIVKRSTQTHPDQDQLRYHVWDCLTLDEWRAGKSSVSNHVRKRRLLPWNEGKYVQMVWAHLVGSKEQLQNVYLEFLEQGYEGAILKNPDGIYECGRRSPNWLKIKPWTDADLTVVESYPGEGKHLGRIGGLVVEGTAQWNDKSYSIRTEVGTGFTDEERVYFQALSDADTLKGRIVEIKFQDITVEGACRFPVYSRLREDKE
jgi:DNA ligase 1